MEKVKRFFLSPWMLKLYKISAYMIIEVLTAEAFKVFLQEKISNPTAYGLAIIVIVQAVEALKAILGKDNKITKIL